jgi:hypothetical protein
MNNKVSVLTKNAYCKSRPNCPLKGERCMFCEYGNLVTVSYKVALSLLVDEKTKGNE